MDSKRHACTRLLPITDCASPSTKLVSGHLTYYIQEAPKASFASTILAREILQPSYSQWTSPNRCICGLRNCSWLWGRTKRGRANTELFGMKLRWIAAFARAQTVAAHISSVVIPRVFTVTDKGDGEKVLPCPVSLVKPTEDHIYKLEAARRLPITNLRFTPSWYVLNCTRNLAFLKWTKQRFRVFMWMNRLGLLLGMTALVLPRQFAPPLVALACMLAFPASFCSYAVLSTDVLRILLKHYEFWFFTVVNAITWIALGSLCRDARIAFIVFAFIDTELMVLMDANFRTFVPAVKTCAGAIPVLILVSVLVILRQVDLPPNLPEPIRLGKVTLDQAEIFANAILTLVLFLLRKVYNQRKLLSRRYASSRVVRCMILRCALKMQPQDTHASLRTTDGQPLKREYGTRVVLKKLGITAHKVHAGIKTGRALNCRQQLMLVSLRLSTIDVCKTLFPRWWNVENTMRNYVLPLYYCIGALGLLLSGGSMLIPGNEGETAFISLSQTWIVGVPLLGFTCTFVFCAVFACAYQRDLVRAMFRNFSFLFPSVQCSLACICLADSMRWDNRCWAIASYNLWFHWILLLDALTPPSRKQLRFRKQLAVPVVIAVWIGMLSVLYAIIIDSPTLNDRTLLHWTLGRKIITTRTKSILLNRIFTILVWSIRLMWQILSASENELVLLRGTLDYYCPFDTFSGTAKRGSLKSIVPANTTRRESGSMVLLPSTDSTDERRLSLQRLLRLASYHQPVLPELGVQSSMLSLPQQSAHDLLDIKRRSRVQSFEAAVLATDAPSTTCKIEVISRQSYRRDLSPNQEDSCEASPEMGVEADVDQRKQP